MFYNPKISVLGVMVSWALFCSNAEAREHRVQQLPHGVQFSCDICHTPTRGLTDFGFDSFEFTEGGNVVWARLAERDSDGDGYTNGVELGDPNGAWRPGQANPAGPISDPGDADSNFCGDGNFQENEECEGGDLRGASCESLGLVVGSLSCSNRCVFDTSECGACGDGVKQDDEECDGEDFGDATCAALGFENGELGCSSSCELLTQACAGESHGSIPATCGNLVRDEGENCDGSDVGSATCVSLGFNGGLLKCTAQCTYDSTPCFAAESPSTPTDDPVKTPATQSPSEAGSTTGIELEGKACSAVGLESSLLWFFALFFRRRKSGASG